MNINLFKKGNNNNSNYSVSTNNTRNEPNNKNSFLQSIKFEQDPDIVRLLQIQDELERRGINEENAFELTKDLSEQQKQKLENLYKKQIRELESSLGIYKKQTIPIKQNLNT